MKQSGNIQPNSVQERLLELVRNSGASLSSLSELIGRNTTYLQQFIRKGSPRKLEEQDRRKLAQFFGVDESELGADVEVKSYSAISDSKVAPPKLTRNWVEVPRLDLGASAGPGALSDSGEQVFDTFQFSEQWLREQGLTDANLSAIAVEGDSMEPLLRDGDEMLVDCSSAAFRDGIYVVRLGDALMVKRVAAAAKGQYALISQNLAYPPIIASAEDVAIIGRVVWKSGRL